MFADGIFYSANRKLPRSVPAVLSRASVVSSVPLSM